MRHPAMRFQPFAYVLSVIGPESADREAVMGLARIHDPSAGKEPIEG